MLCRVGPLVPMCAEIQAGGEGCAEWLIGSYVFPFVVEKEPSIPVIDVSLSDMHTYCRFLFNCVCHFFHCNGCF